MTGKNKLRLLITMAVILIVLFGSCLFILIKDAEQHFLSSAQIITSQIESLITGNENEKSELQDSLFLSYSAGMK